MVFPGHPARAFFRAYVYMLPGVLAMLLVARHLPLVIQEVGMAVVLSAFVVAGAVKGLGLRADVPWFRLAVERFFAYLTDLTVLLGGGVLLGLMALGVGTAAAQVLPVPPRGLAIPTFLVLVGPVLYRCWPVLSLAYLLPEHPAAEGGSLWARLSFGAAARLTRFHDPQGLTWFVLAACYASLLTLALVAIMPAEAGLQPLLIGAFYLIFLPVTVFVVVACCVHLWAEARGVPLPGLRTAAAEASLGAEPAPWPGTLPEPVWETPVWEDTPPEALPAPGPEPPAPGPLPEPDPEAPGVDGGEPAAPDDEAVPEAGDDAAPETAADDAAGEAAPSLTEPVPVAEPVVRPYTYFRLFPRDIRPPLTPFDEGGTGAFFVYLAPRNICTGLFHPRAVDAAFLRELYQHFTLGNATLYIVEKWFVARPGDALADDVPPVPRPAAGRGVRYGVFRDPAQTPRGEAAFVTEYQNPANAAQAALDLSRRQDVAVLAGRLVEVFDWD